MSHSDTAIGRISMPEADLLQDPTPEIFELLVNAATTRDLPAALIFQLLRDSPATRLPAAHLIDGS